MPRTTFIELWSNEGRALLVNVDQITTITDDGAKTLVFTTESETPIVATEHFLNIHAVLGEIASIVPVPDPRPWEADQSEGGDPRD